MTQLHIDFETRSEAELGGSTGVGLYNYAVHESTRVLMLAWAVDEEEPQLWEPHKNAMPERLRTLLLDPTVTLVAFNSGFERNILLCQLGIDVPAERFQDPQPSARYLSLPANLEDVGMVLGLPPELQKDKRGEDLLSLFSYPQTRTKTYLKKNPGAAPVYFNDWKSHPAEWEQLGQYAMQDIRAEREVGRKLARIRVYPLPDRERQIWLLDQKINDRGMPMDINFVQKAFTIADRDKTDKLEEQNQATGLENANSQAQLLPWVQKRGYPLNNLRKPNIELTLNDPDIKIEDEARDVLEARLIASSTSYKKLQAMIRNISPDGRLRNQFIYMGSSRCGRWSGNAVQLHNMARPDGTFEDMNNVTKARQLVYDQDFEGMKIAFKDEKKSKKKGRDIFYAPLIITKNLIRTVFVAPPGKRFNVCDLNAIETRVAAWVSQCAPLLKVFEERRDPYVDFASKMYGILYEKIAADLKSKDPKVKAAAKLMRQIAKPGVLGAVYRLGPGGWGIDPKTGDRIKTGLWGYAEAMGVEMTLDQARDVVKIFREVYKEIVETWYTLERLVKEVLEGERVVRYFGPDNSIKIDKLTVKDRNPILRIQLPSGRYLHYMDAEMQDVTMPWTVKKTDEDGNEYEQAAIKLGFTYYGKNQTTDQWSLIVSHGGKIFENIVQAIARDVLADKLLEFEAIGLEVVGHVHDEGICLSDDDPFAPGVLEMEAIMDKPVSWAPTLPLGSDGFEDSFYHK